MCALYSRDESVLKPFAVLGVIPDQYFVTQIDDVVAFQRSSIEKFTPVFTKNYAVVGKVPIPDRKARTDQR